MALQVILIVLAQLTDASPGHIEQFQFHLGAGLAILAAFHNVLFPAAGSLHHLVYSAVAIRWQETPTEDTRQLNKHIRLLVEVEIVPVSRRLKDRLIRL